MSLEEQLAMNRETWEALEEAGVTAGTKLRLDFLYLAPHEAGASALAEFLGRETDYDVRVSSSGGGFLRKKAWAVSGQTRETEVTPAVLDDWVEWMVAAGAEHGGCDFDGWGAEIP